jgi:hypothetical protein
MTIRHLRIIGAVALGLLALTLAVNLWQAMSGYNLPGSAIVAALNTVVLLVCGPMMFRN